ncbi:MAG TPA: hypothetical protein VNX28_18160 [Gemmataceae bacterium]|jgi:hypothetical protein|nr:hypothetical protein [Gemmataceae bacterium]
MYFDAFKHFREEERYEVGLASGRLASLLASQAFLFTAWAILHGHTETPKLILIVVPAVAFSICLVAFMAILVAVLIIRRWQSHGNRLIRTDRELMDYHVDRQPGDWYHIFGVDVFSLLIPVLFMGLWLTILAYSISIPAPSTANLQKSPTPTGKTDSDKNPINENRVRNSAEGPTMNMSVLIPLVTFVLGFVASLVLYRMTYSGNVDIAHANAIMQVEAKIEDDELPLYGIDLKAVDDEGKTPEDRGVTVKRICYVIAIVNAQNLRFGRNKMGDKINTSELAEMFTEDYMPRFFAQVITREVWRQARRCFRETLRTPVDNYLTKKYKDEFQKRPLPAL